CRLGHAFMGEYYAKFKLPEPVECPCGEPYQTREHLIRDCLLYEEHRHILREASEQISLPEILGTEEGIEALAEWMEKSGAFTKTGEPRTKWEKPVWEEEPDVGEEDAWEDE
ncbi:hypothetical protein PLICRDRAFT_74067, partial [Plicaturopsis crispa FD-325 SS-3]